MDIDLPPDSPELSAPVQCYLPKAVAEALDLGTVRQRARAAGIDGASLEYSTYRLPHEHRGDVLVTTKVATALFLLEQIRARGDSTESAALLLACAAAFKALDAAIQEGLRFWRSAPGRNRD